MSEEREQQVGGTTEQTTGDDAAKQAALAGDAAAAGSETVAEDEKGERQDWKRRYLTEVTPALEEKNRLKQEAEELRERLRSVEQQKPPTGADPQATQDAARLEHLRRRMAAAQQQADAGDATAELTLMNLQEVYRLQQERISERTEMQREREDERYTVRARVVDEDTGELRPLNDDEVTELDRFYDRNRAQFSSKQAAHDALLGRKYRERASSLAKAKKQATEVVERRETKDVIRTTTRDVSATEAKARRMTKDAFDTEYSRLMANGDNGAAYKLKKDLIAGLIDIG